MRSATDYRMASREAYKLFKEDHTELKISYSDFVGIIYAFNYGFRDYLLETGMKGKLPWGFGDFAISKKKPLLKKLLKDGTEIVSLPIDWKKTREKGKKIYHMNAHTEGYKFRIKWFRTTQRFEYSEIWNFKPSRVTSRLVKHYITQGHQHRYYEWDGVK